jgi:hypothetical protein
MNEQKNNHRTTEFIQFHLYLQTRIVFEEENKKEEEE